MARRPRKRRSQAEIEQLERQVIEIISVDGPMSLRGVFYRLTDPTLPEPIEKSERGYKQVQQRVAKMRRSGQVPYSEIIDDTRWGYHVRRHRDANDALRACWRAYRGNLWRDAPVYAEVWTESRSLAGILADTCNDLQVSLYASGGFGSLSLNYGAALQINEETRNGEIPARVFYVGDYDAAGLLIPEKNEKEVRSHLDPHVSMTWHRLAVNPDQIAAWNLPTKPSKAGERRMKHITQTVEAEAIAAPELRRMVHDAVTDCLPAEALDLARAAEESEKDIILWATQQAALKRLSPEWTTDLEA